MPPAKRGSEYQSLSRRPPYKKTGAAGAGLLSFRPPLRQGDPLVHKGRQDTEDHNGHEYQVQFKYLAPINDQISQPQPGGQKFSDDHSHQAEPHVYLHIADDQRDRSGKKDLKQDLPLSSPQGADQTGLVRVHGHKSVVER